MKILYDVYHPGETPAGINAFEDTVTIKIDSGDPGGEDGDFAEFMRESLADWYEGAKVRIEEINK